MTKALRELLYSTESVKVPKADIFTAIKYGFRRFYRKLVKKDWFVKAVVSFFILQSFCPGAGLLFALC